MNEVYYINTFNCESVSDKFFFVSCDMNLVLEYSFDKDKIILLPPPDENMFERGLYGNVVALDDSIFLIPFNAKHIWKLCDKSRWEEIPCPGHEYIGKFLGAISVDKFIYLLGYGRKVIYKLNMLTYQATELRIDIESQMMELGDAGFLGLDYEIVGKRIIIPVMCTDKILEIDTETDLINVIDVPGRAKGYSGIVYDGSSFWLAPRKGKYFVHYLLNGKVEEYELPGEYKNDEMYFGGAYREGNHIVFTAFYGKNFRFNPESPNEYEVFGPSIYYYKMLKNKGKVIHERKGQTYYIDLHGDTRKINLSISFADRLEYIAKYISDKMIIKEGKDISLSEYLRVVEFRSS